MPTTPSSSTAIPSKQMSGSSATSYSSWRTREKLRLASVVQKCGEGEWATISKMLKNISGGERPEKFYSKENCAQQWQAMLETLDTKQQRRRGGGGASTNSASQLVCSLTMQRMEELRREIDADKKQYVRMKKEISDIVAGKVDHQISYMLEQSIAYDRSRNLRDDDADFLDLNAKVSLLWPPEMDNEPEVTSSSSSAEPLSEEAPKREEAAADDTYTLSKPSSFSTDLPNLQDLQVRLLESGGGAEDDEPLSRLVPEPKTAPEATEKQGTNDSAEEIAGEATDSSSKPEKMDTSSSKQASAVSPKTPIPLKPDKSPKSATPVRKRSRPPITTATEALTTPKRETRRSAVTVAETRSETAGVKTTEAGADVEFVEKKDRVTRSASAESAEQSETPSRSSPRKRALNKGARQTEETAVPSRSPEISPVKRLKLTKGPKDTAETEQPEFQPQAEDEKRRVPSIKLDLKRGTVTVAPKIALPPADLKQTAVEQKQKSPPVGQEATPVKLPSDFSYPTVSSTPSAVKNDATQFAGPETPFDQKQWRQRILTAHRNISQHKHANIFVHPVSDSIAPGYSTIVKEPMDLTKLKRMVDHGQLTTTVEFKRHLLLMFANAVMYNSWEHDVHVMTKEMAPNAIDEIQRLMNPELDDFSAADLAKSRRSGRLHQEDIQASTFRSE